MAVEIEFTDEFGGWWDVITASEQSKVGAGVDLLRQFGVSLSFPHCSGVQGSRHTQMRELRVQVEGLPFRILYAFNPIRNAILLLGGDKAGNDRV